MSKKCMKSPKNVLNSHLEQILGLCVHLRNKLAEIPGPTVGKTVAQDGGVLRPVCLRRGAQHPEDFSQLVHLVLAGEERLAGEELGKDAPAGPDVHRRGVAGAE